MFIMHYQLGYACLAVTFALYAKMEENEPGPFWSEKFKKKYGEGHQITPVLRVKQVAEL